MLTCFSFSIEKLIILPTPERAFILDFPVISLNVPGFSHFLLRERTLVASGHVTPWDNKKLIHRCRINVLSLFC